ENKKILIKDSNKGRILTDYGKEYIDELLFKNENVKIANQIVNIVQDVSKARLLEVLQLRVLIEPEGVKMAAANCKTENAEILDRILIDYAYEIQHNMSGGKSDFVLHTYIAKLSGNETLYEIIKLLLQKNDAYVQFSEANILAHQKIKQHKDIIDAIIANDCEKAKEKMKYHLVEVINDIERFY
ncbi:MAG: FCD domain-containing protein, partial [Tissierellia bacterium]|nr:FCD domain-containing protein [Tissierellia bacterium]